MIRKLVFINVAVFLVLRIAMAIAMLLDYDLTIVSYLKYPAQFSELVFAPWTIITYMFCHFDGLHLLMNMLWLWWFGHIFIEFNTQKQLFALYILGGIGGALIYSLAYSTLPAFGDVPGSLIGASASIFAIVLATTIKAPNYGVNLFFFGNVQLKWLTLVVVVIDFISITEGNAGGHISHIGGYMVGALYALLQRSGFDITAVFNKAIDKLSGIFTRRSKSPRVGNKRYHYRKSEPAGASTQMNSNDETVIDEILKKIKQSGYTSLTDEEKQRLFSVSKKL